MMSFFNMVINFYNYKIQSKFSYYMKKVAGAIAATFKRIVIKVYYANACIIPKADASITTHFQQYVLFNFICIYFMNVKIHATSF